MPICRKCSNSFEGKFCPNCGAKYNAEIICPTCGSRVSSEQETCPECGESLSVHICSNCNKSFEGDVCPNCGAKYADATNSDDTEYRYRKAPQSSTASYSNQTPRKKKKGWIIVIALLVLYIGLSALDALGVFVMGTYNDFEDGEPNPDSSPVIVKFYGELGGEDGEWGMSYKVHGEDMTIYWGNAELMSGKVVNGVMKVSFMGEDDYYCKDGKEPDDFNEKGFMDYFRTILSPASKLISNIIYDKKDNKIDNDEAENNTENNTGNNDNTIGSNATHSCNYNSKGICTICNKSIAMNLAIPDTPIIIENNYAGNYQAHSITSVTCEISNYNTTSNTISYKITVIGQPYGRNAGGAYRVRWKIVDSNGIVIETDGEYSPHVAADESFTLSFNISGLYANMDYSLTFIKDN